MVETKRASPGENLHLTIDAAIQERTEQVLGRGGLHLAAQGRHRAGARPAHRRRARAGQLAARGRERPRRRRRRGRASDRSVAVSYEPGSTFKAFTVAGRAPGAADRARTRRSSCRPRSSVADRMIGEAHDRGHGDAAGVGHPGPVLERGLGDDRPEARRPAVRPLGPPLRLRAPDRHRAARRAAGHRAALRKDYSGSSIGNLPIGQGLAVTPMQMAARLHRDRQPRA